MFGSTYFAGQEFGSEQLYSFPQSVAPTGIATSEAFGTTVVLAGGTFIVPSGIASQETFGATVITTGVVVITPAGIASGEAFGSAAVSTAGTVAGVSVTGISSGEAFGDALVDVEQILSLSGITSAEAFGTPRLTVFTASFAPINPITPDVWVGYDESNDVSTISTADPTQAATWVPDGNLAATYSPDSPDSSGSWVAN